MQNIGIFRESNQKRYKPAENASTAVALVVERINHLDEVRKKLPKTRKGAVIRQLRELSIALRLL